ncbi:hypothetical protein [Legionella feeleii]|uniref:Uncharacterized protein n=1 Tax=Legionella feeleii TaxID=453 RepID=A0A0W0U1M3_9GAMM|nr:hypothetical protein [Legionella feeleii]KTD02035.1 hypothetical protein Lfee_0880 [Legionella feeleii]SPX59882.1 Uncharacterised protein [Legionella feeleii]
MGRKAYTTAVRFLRDVTQLDFFGWADEELQVDAVAYVSYKEFAKCALLLQIPANIRQKMSLEFTPNFLRITVPKINVKPMSTELGKFMLAAKNPSVTKRPDHLTEQRIMRVATVATPTGGFTQLAPRTVKEQVDLFATHVGSAYKLMLEQGALLPDEPAICVLPEFYSHCRSPETSRLFMPYDMQQQLLAGYCAVSKEFPELLIMVNITATTKDMVVDELGKSLEHRARLQKTNMLFGIKNGEVVYINYKVNKGPADIPEDERLSAESERNSYYHATADKRVMKLDYLKQFKGITFAGSVCIDAAEGVIGKYLRQQFSSFSEDEFGPAVQIISSSSMTLSQGFKKRSALVNTDNGAQQIVTPKTGQGILIQADGHNTLKRSGVWIVDGENLISQTPVNTQVLSDKTEISAYSIGVNLLHNKLHNEVGMDIEEESSTALTEGVIALGA